MTAARRMLLLFFGLIWLYLFRRGFISFLGVDTGYYFGLLSLPTLYMATWLYRKHLGPLPSSDTYKTHLKLFAAAIILLAVYGYLNLNLVHHILLAIAILSVTLCFLILGQYDRVWQDLEKPLTFLLVLGIIAVAIGTMRPAVSLSYRGLEIGELERQGRFGVGTLAYDLEQLLGLCPLLFALAFTRPRWDWVKLVGIIGILAYIGFQIFFQKRGTPVQAGFYVIVAILVIGARYHRRIRWGPILLLLAGAWIATMVVGSYHIGRLQERWARTESLAQNERWYEAKTLLSQFNGHDWVIGRGLGGWFESPTEWAETNVVSRSGALGRTHMHVGMLWPFLVGGIVFWLIYNSFFFRWLKPKNSRWYLNRYNVAAAAVIPVYWLFQLIGGAPSMANQPLDAVLVGLTCARLALPVTIPLEDAEWGHHGQCNVEMMREASYSR